MCKECFVLYKNNKALILLVVWARLIHFYLVQFTLYYFVLIFLVKRFSIIHAFIIND